MGYSPDLFTVEKSYLISRLLCRFFGKSRIITDNSLSDKARTCGHYLRHVNTYFERFFPDESKELREFLPADEKVIEIVLGNINEDTSSVRDRRFLEVTLQDLGLEPSLVQEIISKSLALKAKVKQTFFSMNNLESEYGPLFCQLGLRDEDDSYNLHVSLYSRYLISSFYVENFPTNRELYEALFGKDLQLFTTFGEPLWETSDLRRHLIALDMENKRLVTFSPEKRKPLKQFKRLVFERLEIHKEKAGILVVDLEDDLKVTPLIMIDNPAEISIDPIKLIDPHTKSKESFEKPASRPRNYELGVIINSIGFLSFLVTGFAIFSALTRGNLN